MGPETKVNGSPVKNLALDPAGSVVKSGRMRHLLALFALSSFVMANMNRQAYNQGLARMIRKSPRVPSFGADTSAPTTSAAPEPASTWPPEFGPEARTELAPTTLPNVDFGGTTPGTFEADTTVAFGEDTSTSTGATNASAELLDQDDQDDGYDWTGAQISMLQAAFSYGYTVFMIPGGRLSEIYGAKWVIFLSSFGSALCSLATPFFANHSYALLVASRVFMGLCQTGVSPAMYAFCSRWLPPDEASVYLPMIKVGVMLGFMSGSLLNGFLPWRTMFYTVGLGGLLWSSLWALFATSDPRDHKFIHKTELAYIQQCLAARREANERNHQKRKAKDGGGDDDNKKRGSSGSAPWWGIISNPVVLAFTFTKFTVKLSTDSQSMQIPMYLRRVFNVSDGLNGFLNGTNFAIQALFTGVVAYTAKEMVVRKKFGLNKTGVRVLFQCINNFGMATAYLLISFNMGSLNVVCCAVILLSVASMFGAGGEAVLPIDLTTEYSASIMAIANSAANMSGIVLPPIVSFLLANELTNADHWSRVWWFIGSVMICGGLMFGCFVEAKLQNFHGKEKEDSPAADAQQPKRNGTNHANGSVPTQVAIEMGPETEIKNTTRL